MCQAILSLKIEPATDGEMKSAVKQLHAVVASCLENPNYQTAHGIETAAKIVGRPSIRARIRRSSPDVLSTIIRRVDELLAYRRNEGEQRLIARIWNALNEPGFNLALADDARSTNRLH